MAFEESSLTRMRMDRIIEQNEQITRLKADLASKKAILKMLDFPCHTCKKRARADELYLCYGCKHYFCEKCAPIHFDGIQEIDDFKKGILK